MKKYIKPSTADKILNIIIDIETIPVDIAADINVTHPINIKRSKRLSEQKLTILSDIVNSSIAVINSYNFKIDKQYQSKRSYACYVWFYATDKDGNQNIKIELIFRFGDHLLTSDDEDIITGKVRIKNFSIGEEQFNNSIAFIDEIDYICNELQKGNIGVLDEY